MKKLGDILVCAAIAALAGCGSNVESGKTDITEAEALGYKGLDLEHFDAKNFIITAPAVTNYVPERVLSVVEKYEFSNPELKLLEDFGVLIPSQSHKAMPEGYVRDSDEPWFVYWVKKPVVSFGLTGVAGVLSHYDEDAQLWHTSGTYFSSYYKTEKEAVDALEKIKTTLEANYSVKRFHSIATGWVAEYLRLCVMGVVGQKADGTWACMLDFRDKCNYGCGPWESVLEQQQRQNRYVYQKEMKAWHKTMAKILDKNHNAVLAKMTERGKIGFEDAKGPYQGVDGRYEFSKEVPLENLLQTNDLKFVASSVWSSALAEVKTALGGNFEGEVAEDAGDDYHLMIAVWDTDLHNIRVVLLVGEGMVPAEEGESAELKTEVVGFWRVLFSEKIITGEEIPLKPTLKN